MGAMPFKDLHVWAALVAQDLNLSNRSPSAALTALYAWTQQCFVWGQCALCDIGSLKNLIGQ